MTEEEVRAEVGTKAIKFIDEHEKDCLTGFEMMRDFAYEVTKDLEKENAELKEKYVKNITDCDICDTYCNSQLNKAKEIIKNLLFFLNKFYSEDCPVCMDEAEQFLSEVEK